MWFIVVRYMRSQQFFQIQIFVKNHLFGQKLYFLIVYIARFVIPIKPFYAINISTQSCSLYSRRKHNMLGLAQHFLKGRILKLLFRKFVSRQATIPQEHIFSVLAIHTGFPVRKKSTYSIMTS